jgi:hypothetical protein
LPSFAFFTFAILAIFRVETPSFVAGALETTLAFFVAFSELIKLFLSIVINHTSKVGLHTNDDEKGPSNDSPFQCVLPLESFDVSPSKVRLQHK